MLKFLLWPMLCGCVLLVDGPASGDERKADCSSPNTQAEMTICAGKDLTEADKALNAQYQATRKVLKQQDAEASTPDLKGAEAALLAAQRAWLGYRDAQCVSAGFQARGGSMEPMLISSCQADLTRTRTEELKALVETMN